MRFGIGTLKRTISALMIGAFLFVGMAAPAEAQKRGKNKWDRHDTWGRRDNGRHTGWTRGRHLGWRNRNRDRDDDDRRRRWRRAFRRDRRDDRRDWRDNRRAFRQRQRWDRNDWRTRAYGNRVGFNRRRFR